MSKCVICKVGTEKQSGCHMYCDKCGSRRFAMTDDYINAASTLVGTLISNTAYEAEELFLRDVMDMIKIHLPVVHQYALTYTNGYSELMTSIVETAKSQALNLQIEQTVHNHAPQEQKLVCQCGSTDFNMVSPGELRCSSYNCDAKYVFDHDKQKYMPYFLCTCSWATYTYIDEQSGLCLCDQCGKHYMHDQVHHMFTPID